MRSSKNRRVSRPSKAREVTTISTEYDPLWYRVFSGEDKTTINPRPVGYYAK
jgi:hypothetical protein